MTRYEQGFLTKCASAGLPEEVAVALLKRAQSPDDMVWYNGSMIPRANYDAIMASKKSQLTPQQIQQNRLKAIGRGWQIQNQQQQARYAKTRRMQPRGPNGQLQTINLRGQPTSPYSSRPGVRGIPRAAGS